MTNKIKVLVTDDITTRESIIDVLKSCEDILVIGQAASAEETFQQAKLLEPDIILMNVTLPDMNGFSATKTLVREFPFSCVILMSTEGNLEDIRQAMIMGAKDYILKPIKNDELLQSIKQVYANSEKVIVSPTKLQEGKIVTLFSTKGGVGKTILATNLSVALASKCRCKVAILDFDLQFGDVAVCLNVLPKASVADLITDIEHLDNDTLSRYMVSFNDNLDILPAPFKPEQAEMITAQHLIKILNLLKKQYQYIIIDTAPAFDDKTLTALDFSDLVFVVSVPDLTTTKNVKLSLKTLESLEYSLDKIKLVMNRFNSKGSLDIEEIEGSLSYPFSCLLPNDSAVVLASVNKGVPFIVSHPDSQISKAIFDLAGKIVNDSLRNNEKNSKNKKSGDGIFSGFKKIFSKKNDD